MFIVGLAGKQLPGPMSAQSYKDAKIQAPLRLNDYQKDVDAISEKVAEVIDGIGKKMKVNVSPVRGARGYLYYFAYKPGMIQLPICGQQCHDDFGEKKVFEAQTSAQAQADSDDFWKLNGYRKNESGVKLLGCLFDEQGTVKSGSDTVQGTTDDFKLLVFQTVVYDRDRAFVFAEIPIKGKDKTGKKYGMGRIQAHEWENSHTMRFTRSGVLKEVQIEALDAHHDWWELARRHAVFYGPTIGIKAPSELKPDSKALKFGGHFDQPGKIKVNISFISLLCLFVFISSLLSYRNGCITACLLPLTSDRVLHFRLH